MEAPKLCPYSHSSLGKFVLEYQHNGNTSSSKLSSRRKANSTNSSSSSGGRHDLTLSIPESDLTWKGGSRSAGTQMLVFRASQHVPGAKNDLTSVRKRARLPSSSKKPGRKTVALELNRINPAKFQSQVTPSSTMAAPQSHHDQSVADSYITLNKGGRPGVVESQSSRRKSSSSSVENLSGAPSIQKVVHVNGHGSLVATNEASVKSSSEINWSDCNHSQEEADSSMESSSEANCGAARTMGLYKKPEMRDIGVMTDLCGIDSVLDLSPVGSNSNHKGSKNLRLSLQPCPSLKKGCTDRCTSPGFPSKHQPFRNGGVNGFMFNGYASPDVLTLRAGPGIYQQNKKKKALSLLQNHTGHQQQAEYVLDLERNGGGEATMTHTDPEMGEIRPRGEFQAVAGDGGELPFKVSIPRNVLNSSSSGDDSCNNGTTIKPVATAEGAAITREGLEEEIQTSSNDTNKKGSAHSSMTGAQPQQQQVKSPSPYKRRSEVQLLLDGDKPPSERISASEVPIFTAEDVSSRNTRNTGRGNNSGGGQLNKSWLDSSTRKITPVDHFDYAFVSLTEKVTGIVHSSSSSGGGGSSSGVSSSIANSRKRNISDSEGTPSTTLASGQGGSSGAVPPPTKQAKVVRDNSASIDTEENCQLDGMEPSSESGAALTSPTALGSAAQEATGDIGKAIAGYGSNSSLESESLGMTAGDGDSCLVDTNSLFQPDDVFASELVVFDSRGDCLLKEGEYSILMQRCSKKESVRDVPGLLTFPPLTWSSVFAGGHTNSKVNNGELKQLSSCQYTLYYYSCMVLLLS